MVRSKSGEKTTWHLWKSRRKSWDFSYQPQLVSLPDFWLPTDMAHCVSPLPQPSSPRLQPFGTSQLWYFDLKVAGNSRPKGPKGRCFFAQKIHENLRVLRCPRWKLGSMVSKWVISPTYKMVYIGVITHLLAFDPNFLRHPSTPPPPMPPMPAGLMIGDYEAHHCHLIISDHKGALIFWQ